MKTRLWILVLIALLASLPMVAAQDDTGSETTDATSTVNWFFVACENQAIVDLNGTMEAGYDVYVQVFRDFSATGTPLTALRRAPVAGAYEISLVLPYNEGETLLFGQFASARISIAREGNAETTLFTTTVDDSQDGCVEPTFGQTDTTASGSGQAIDPETGEPITGEPGQVVSSSGIYSPFGGFLNPVFFEELVPESIVEIGARPSENRREAGRTNNPGLIFAECDDYPTADPGRIFDTDNLVVFWSWFARTPAQVRDHIAKAKYEIFLDSEFVPPQTFPNVQVSPVVQREDGNYWVFYTANLGDRFRPGNYRIGYKVIWEEVLTDGYEDFGPGTETPEIQSSCTFTIEENPYGLDVSPRNPTVPLQQPE